MAKQTSLTRYMTCGFSASPLISRLARNDSLGVVPFCNFIEGEKLAGMPWTSVLILHFNLLFVCLHAFVSCSSA